LLLSLTLIPLLAHLTSRRRTAASDTAGAGSDDGRLERLYIAGLARFTGRPLLAGAAVVLLAALAAATYLGMGTGFLPAADEGGFVIDYLTPSGSTLEETDARLRRIEGVLKATPEVATYSRRTGSELGLFATQPNSGDVLVRLKPREERDRSSEEIVDALREQFADAAPDTEIEFVQLLQDMLGDLEGNPDPIEVKIFGDDPDTLATIAEDVESKIEHLDGIVDVVGPSRGNPEVTWQIDPLKAQQLGLTVDGVSTQLAAAWSGAMATDLRLADRTVPVRVRYPDAYRFSPDRLLATPVRGENGRTVPAGSLATISTETGQEELLRENLRQMGMVTAHLEGRDLGSAVQDIQAALAGLRLPVGYSLEVGGQYAAQRQAFVQLLVVAAIGTSLVFVILVVQFRRFRHALLILAAAPLSLGGAFLILILTGTDLNVSSAMGLILLVGLAVKNGIVLLDFVELRRADGLPPADAVQAAARVRLRPILMTTLCTLFGLLPLAIGLGAGAELQKPLALAVIGGLTLSTFVTLVLVPAGYLALERWGQTAGSDQGVRP
jgi:multidrug efflux pump subunit AcrB